MKHKAILIFFQSHSQPTEVKHAYCNQFLLLCVCIWTTTTTRRKQLYITKLFDLNVAK